MQSLANQNEQSYFSTLSCCDASINFYHLNLLILIFSVIFLIYLGERLYNFNFGHLSKVPNQMLQTMCEKPLRLAILFQYVQVYRFYRISSCCTSSRLLSVYLSAMIMGINLKSSINEHENVWNCVELCMQMSNKINMVFIECWSNKQLE